MYRQTSIALTVASALALGACAADDPNRRAKQGALIGAIGGAVAGSAIGDTEGAIIGGAVGAIVIFSCGSRLHTSSSSHSSPTHWLKNVGGALPKPRSSWRRDGMPLRACRRGSSYGSLQQRQEQPSGRAVSGDQEKEERSTAVSCAPLCGNHLIVLLLLLVIVVITVGVGGGCGGGGLVVAWIEATAEVEALHRRAVTQQAHRAGFLTTPPRLSQG